MDGFLAVCGYAEAVVDALQGSSEGRALMAVSVLEFPFADRRLVCQQFEFTSSQFPLTICAVSCREILYSGYVLVSAGGGDAGNSKHRSISDAFLRHGVCFPRGLDGEFSAAVFDFAENRIVVGNDFFGVRGAYYVKGAGFAAVSDSVTVLVKLFGHLLSYDLEVIAAFLQRQQLCDLLDDRTFYCGLGRVAAGSTVVISLGGTISSITHRATVASSVAPLDKMSAEDQLSEFERAIRQSIRWRLSIGVRSLALSGGLDSAVLAAGVAEFGGRSQVRSFTSSFGSLHQSDEDSFAAATASATNLPLTIMSREHDRYRFPMASPTGWAEEALSVFCSNDQFRTMSPDGFPVLSGLGSDEAFSSTRLRYAQLSIWMRIRGLALKLRRFHGGQREPRSSGAACTVPPWLSKSVAAYCSDAGVAHARRHWMVPLAQADFFSTSEVCDDVGWLRSSYTLPFLDRNVLAVILASGVGKLERFKSGFPQKRLLRTWLRGRIPDLVVERPKVPAGAVASSIAAASKSWLGSLNAQDCPDIVEFVRFEMLPEFGAGDEEVWLYPRLAILSLMSWQHHSRVLRGTSVFRIAGSSNE